MKSVARASRQRRRATIAESVQSTGAPYVLRLFVTGMTPRAGRAIENVRAICDEHLEGRYDLEVIDVYQQPALARVEQIVAAPTLIKELPLPLRRLIGDMSNRDRVLAALDLTRS